MQNQPVFNAKPAAFLPVLLFTLAIAPLRADTHSAASCEFADVNAAVEAASQGDTVQLPAETATWKSTLTINKGIILRGTGKDSTILRNGNPDGTEAVHCLIVISLPADVPVRITGIRFDNLINPGYGHVPGWGGYDKSAIAVRGRVDGSRGSTQVRIDHCSFDRGKRAVSWSGWAYGLVDHNIFQNADICVSVQGDNNYAWERPISAGTADAVFIEDNTFLIDDLVDYECNEPVYHQEGGRSVTRFNTFDSRGYTKGYSCIFDTHGNLNLYRGDAEDLRGQPVIEVYNNTLMFHHTYRVFNLRGGSMLIHDNTITSVSSTNADAVFCVEEEEAWTSGGPFGAPPAPAAAWPAQDQINNSFFWNNTLNGNPVTGVNLWVPETDALFIQEGRDYFMHAPTATGGKESYPTRPGAADMNFSPSGPNAYYPYTSFTYPHPLRTSGPLSDAALTITTPDGSEAWRLGEIRVITWTANEVPGNLVIELLKDGKVAGIIAPSVAASTGSFDWTAGHLANGTTITGGNLTIRIHTTDGEVIAGRILGANRTVFKE